MIYQIIRFFGIICLVLPLGCSPAPSRIEDGPPVPAPYGYWGFCDRHPTDPVCSFVKR